MEHTIRSKPVKKTSYSSIYNAVMHVLLFYTYEFKQQVKVSVSISGDPPDLALL